MTDVQVRMRTALTMLLVLVACGAGGIGRSPAHADELWQQLPPPAAMPKAEQTAMRRSTTSSCTMQCSARESR